MKKIFFIGFLLMLAGCSTVQIPDYIKADRPYIRKINGKYLDVLDVVKLVLFKHGWEIQNQVNPSIYERRSDDQDESQDILFFSRIKQHPKVFYSTYTHINVFVRAIAEGAEVEIRYESISPMGIKQFRRFRNDALANRLLDKIEQELESK